MAKVIRLLTYQGSEEWIKKTFENGAVPAKGITHAGTRGTIESVLLNQTPEDMVDDKYYTSSPVPSDLKQEQKPFARPPVNQYEEPIDEVGSLRYQLRQAKEDLQVLKLSYAAMMDNRAESQRLFEADVKYQTGEADKWRAEAVRAFKERDKTRDELVQEKQVLNNEVGRLIEANQLLQKKMKEATTQNDHNILHLEQEIARLSKKLKELGGGTFLQRINDLERELAEAHDALKDNAKTIREMRQMYRVVASHDKPATVYVNDSINKEAITQLEQEVEKWKNAYHQRKHQTYAMAYGGLRQETTKTKEGDAEYANTASGKEVCTMAWRCDSCGTKNFGKDRYCRHCGSKFINGNFGGRG